MITVMTFKKFRSFRDITVSFGSGKNSLIGKNESGKTTVGHGIFFTYFGCDLFGNKNPDHLIMNGEDECSITTTTEKVTISRVKRRGSTSVIQLIRHGIAPIKLNQSELTDLLGLSLEGFGSCFHAGFFMSLPVTKQMEVIGQIAKIDRRELLKFLCPEVSSFLFPIHASKIKLDNLRVDLQVIGNERRAVQGTLNYDQGQLAQLASQQTESPQADFNLAEAEASLKQLKAQVSLYQIYQDSLRRYDQQLAEAKIAKEDNEKISEKKSKIQLELEALDTVAIHKITQVEEQCARLKSKQDAITLRPVIPVPVFTELPDGNCPKCGQMVPTKLKESVILAKEKAINEYNDKARLIETENENLKKEFAALQDQCAEATLWLSDAKSKNATAKAKRELLGHSLSELVVRTVPEPIPPTAPNVSQDVVDQFTKLSLQVQMYQADSTKREKRAQEKERLEESVSKKSKQVSDLKLLEEALQKMPEQEVKQTLDLIRTTNLVMSLKDEELLVSDQAGTPYSALSSGRRKKADIALCEMFQSRVARAPQFYFIDDVELMDSYTLPSGQVFLAKIDSKQEQLSVIRI